MDYEKEYKEALERARALRNEAIENGYVIDYIKDYETIFPELRDSEDEMTRRNLIKFLTTIKEISESGRTTWVVRKDDAEMCKSFLSYLEKQKEQKPAEWSEEDEEHLKSIISTIEMRMNDCEDASAVLGYYDSDISWLKSLRPDKNSNGNEVHKTRY